MPKLFAHYMIGKCSYTYR